jgi:lactoylglutathione lyase
VAKAIHSMIRVLDLERSLRFYATAFGLELADRKDFDDFTLVYLRNAENDFELELTWNHGQEAAYSHGTGYGHLAVSVDDLGSEHARLAGLGLPVRKVVEMEHEGARLARFFFIEDPDGYQIEVIERGGRYR